MALFVATAAAYVPVALTQSSLEWTRVPTSPGTPTGLPYADGLLAYGINGSVYLRRSTAFPFDLVAQPYPAAGLLGDPVLASIADGPSGEERRYVFVAGQGGWLSKLDVATSEANTNLPLKVATTAGALQVRDLRRGGCAVDSLLAEPVVQRRKDSNAQFSLGRDIVIVATAHGCGDTTQNQVIAFDAVDLTRPPLWVFNVGEYEVGPIRACTLDLARNRVHCSAGNPGANFQAGIWSIDTNSGTLAWAGIFDAGVHARAALGTPGSSAAGHLYVGDLRGRVQVFDAADGDLLGSAPVPGVLPNSIETDLAVGDGAYAGSVFAAGDDGILAAYYDDGSDPIEAWQSSFAGGQRIVSEPVPVSTLGKLYVITNDGVFRQLDMASGSEEANAPIHAGVSPPLGIKARLASYRPADGVQRLVGTMHDPTSGNTLTRQYRIPCLYASTDCTFADGDAVSIAAGDNCRYVANPNQANADGDAFGDACDNCPALPNPGQEDIDADALGNACDADADNDGLANDAEGDLGTLWLDPDTDNDGFYDGVEVLALADPNDVGSIPQPLLGGLSLRKSLIAGCKSVTAAVTLTRPAPAGGVSVRLYDSLTAATTPAALTIAAGATSKNATIKSLPVASLQAGAVGATLGYVDVADGLALRPMALSSISLSPTSVTGGDIVEGILKLECKAGPGTIAVELASSNASIANPTVPSVIVPAGAQTASFQVQTAPVAATAKPKITGEANGISKSKTLTVTPP